MRHFYYNGKFIYHTRPTTAGFAASNPLYSIYTFAFFFISSPPLPPCDSIAAAQHSLPISWRRQNGHHGHLSLFFHDTRHREKTESQSLVPSPFVAMEQQQHVSVETATGDGR
jgi:hypothetical protein